MPFGVVSGSCTVSNVVDDVLIDPTLRVQSVYVPVSDGARLAVDVWLPVDQVTRGSTVSTVLRVTPYSRALEPPGPGAELDTNFAAGNMWAQAGIALVLVDARGSGASFGTRTTGLDAREIADYGEVIDWIAAQPWSNGRVGAFGTSYEGMAAELMARLANPHLLAVAAVTSPLDPYRQLFYPGGSANVSTPPEGPAPPPVKPVDGPAGPALLAQALREHQANGNQAEILSRWPSRDDSAEGASWDSVSPASWQNEIESSGVPMLVRAGWVDGGFVAGTLARFATFSNHQEVEIGPWGHGGGSFADPLRPDAALAGDELSPEGQDRRLVDFFTRYLVEGERPEAQRSLRFSTLGTDRWETATSWPLEGVVVRRWYLRSAGHLDEKAGPASTVSYRVDPAASSGATNRWHAIMLGRGAAYPDRRAADSLLLTQTSDPLPTDLHVLGFPVVTLRLATSSSDGAVYVYLEDVGPGGEVSYLSEGCLRFLHRQTAGPAEPTRLGVPRSFSRPDNRPVLAGDYMDLVVELLPVSALLRTGHRARVAIAGHDAASFARYGEAGETFTIELGERSYLDLPVAPPEIPKAEGPKVVKS
jgi:putative CocE/NonD family hydrolase